MDDVLIGMTLGEYEVLERIGQGGMGWVYKARQLSLDRMVAMKVLPPEMCQDEEYIDRFLREARAAAHLNHVNIIQIYDAGVSDGTYFFVMEYVNGKNLTQILRESGPFSELQALEVLKDAALGLNFAHQMGVVHRDVKPENIMLNSGKALKIGDLGLAKWKSHAIDASLTAAGVTMGTPFYIAPEQVRGMKDIDGRADIYALGMTLYHVLEGHPAFHQGSGAEIMAQHLSDPLPPFSRNDISDSLQQLICSMTLKKPEERIQSMSDVAIGAADLLGEEIPHLVKYKRTVSPVVLKEEAESQKLQIGILGVLAVIIFMSGLLIYVLVSRKSKVMVDEPSSTTQAVVVENSTPPPPTEKNVLPAAEVMTDSSQASVESQESPSFDPSQSPHHSKRGSRAHREAKPKEEEKTSPEEKSASEGPETTVAVTEYSDVVPTPGEGAAGQTVEQKSGEVKPSVSSLQRIVIRGPDKILERTISLNTSPKPFMERVRKGPNEMVRFRNDENGDVDTSSFSRDANQFLDTAQKSIINQYVPKVSLVKKNGKIISESRFLIRLKGLVENPGEMPEFLNSIRQAEIAELILPVKDAFSQGSSFKVEIRRLLRPWGQREFDPRQFVKIKSVDWMRQMDQLNDYLREYDHETDWRWAAASRRVEWNRPGAEGEGWDVAPQESGDGKGRILRKPRRDKNMYFNVLPDLKKWAEDAEKNVKDLENPSWIIRVVDGEGEMQFSSLQTPLGAQKKTGSNQEILIILRLRKDPPPEEAH